ncbi:MAG: PQQ-dependent sugar dehydrogenase [Ignavibacteriales bacterium]|nr:MAG: glucose sorbosone dehydrogenase [Ignavibacteriaceae bacterium]MBV6444822.1 hypothetical protein [Ignavibacteriaceae bacterium]MBW7873393.1 PQQ-dependent sugar dehydrogenase [Ignavibacteria bacterium]MCZ2142083.1 PQQ-dependent sugar dehydrogenase [Ignavibacteriales bacterium]WKZ71718.1 MAG: PQQ-dependent sugar dehydrogenase [Ignavibacteriaceae bacterium]
MKISVFLVIVVAFSTAVMISTKPALPQAMKLQNAFPNISIPNAVDFQSPYDKTDRIFVVAQTGKIFVFPNTPTASNPKVFLDLTDRVLYGGEQGLLGLAFHPDYANNGYFYVNYTTSNPRRTHISRFQVSPTNPDSAMKSTELVLLTYNQPYTNHNGGQVAFGPDGYLYIGAGDGGSGGDPQGNGQNKAVFLAKILRIDVNNTSSGKNYAIPPDNPFAGNTQGWKEEIYAYGMRNPWRFSFDPKTNLLWVADVGQNEWEEINIVEKGGNYGWRIMEGFHCYNPSSNCDTTGLKLPIWEYRHNSAGGYSITGGFVYRGNKNPRLYGKYIYGDYVSKRIWALSYTPGQPVQNEVLVNNAGFSITSFGEDTYRNLYIIDYSGKIWKFVEDVDAINRIPNFTGGKFAALKQNYPNPFNPSTSVSFLLGKESDVKVDVYDIYGGLVSEITRGFYQAGEFIFGWEPGKLASGTYLIRMTATATDGAVQSETVKAVYLK